MSTERIGRRLFDDGVERDIYRDQHGQYVLGPDGEKRYGVWTLDSLVQGGVGGRPRPGALGAVARERDRAHASVRATLRGPGRFGAGSSAVSSPISSSKSFASRKFLYTEAKRT